MCPQILRSSRSCNAPTVVMIAVACLAVRRMFATKWRESVHAEEIKQNAVSMLMF
jgi:hypothetical protein